MLVCCCVSPIRQTHFFSAGPGAENTAIFRHGGRQRYTGARLPPLYGVCEQLSVRRYVVPHRWMRVNMRTNRLLREFVLRPPPDRGAAARAQGRTRASSSCARPVAFRTRAAAHGAARTRSMTGMVPRHAYGAVLLAQQRGGGELHLDLRGHDHGAAEKGARRARHDRFGMK